MLKIVFLKFYFKKKKNLCHSIEMFLLKVLGVTQKGFLEIRFFLISRIPFLTAVLHLSVMNTRHNFSTRKLKRVHRRIPMCM